MMWKTVTKLTTLLQYFITFYLDISLKAKSYCVASTKQILMEERTLTKFSEVNRNFSFVILILTLNDRIKSNILLLSHPFFRHFYILTRPRIISLVLQMEVDIVC